MEDVEKGLEDDEDDERVWDGMTDSNSNTSILPKKRMKHKKMKTNCVQKMAFGWSFSEFSNAIGSNCKNSSMINILLIGLDVS